MEERMIPSSPNWYISSPVDSNKNGLLVISARSNVDIFDISDPCLPRFLRHYTGHADYVASVALSPCNMKPFYKELSVSLIADTIGSREGNINFSDEHLCSEEENPNVLCCSGGEDKIVKIWSVDNLHDWFSHSHHKDKVTVVCWSSANPLMVASCDERGEVIVWNLSTNSFIQWRQLKDYIYCAEFSPHHPALLAIGYRQASVFLVNFESRNGEIVHRLRGHTSSVCSLSWCPVPGEDILNISLGTSHDSGTERIPQGCLIATGSKDKTIRVWSCLRGNQLLSRRLPSHRHASRGETANSTWLSVKWPMSFPDCLVSGSMSGDIFLWPLRKGNTETAHCLSPGSLTRHSRVVFGISCAGPDGEILCTTSQDRNLILWNIVERKALACMPTICGQVFCIRTSPIDPGRLAIGAGDSVLRVWHTGSKVSPYDVTTFWHGINSKVTSVAWHPSDERLVGFGTEDGRVGCYDVFSNRPPLLSNTFHDHAVYVVTWAQSLSPSNTAITHPHKDMSLYSVGDMKMFEHSMSVLRRLSDCGEAVDISEMLGQANPDQPGGTKAENHYRTADCYSRHAAACLMSDVRVSEVSFNAETGTIAVASNDGSVYIVRMIDLRLLAVVKTHKKLITCVRWHPLATEESPSRSRCQHWLASGGNDHVLHVVDLSAVVSDHQVKDGVGVKTITTPLREFRGHSQRITDIAWSPYLDGRLVSVGYRAEAFVWDVLHDVHLAQFNGHWGNVMTCQFSEMDEDVVITGASDSTVRMWRVSAQPAPVFGHKRLRKRKAVHASDACVAVGESAVSSEPTMEGGSDFSLVELEEVLEEKRQSLLTGGVVTERSCGDGGDSQLVNQQSVDVKSRDGGSTQAMLERPSSAFMDAVQGSNGLPDGERSWSESTGDSDAGGEVSVVGQAPLKYVPGVAGMEVNSSQRRESGDCNNNGHLHAAIKVMKKGRITKSHFPVIRQAENNGGRKATYDDIVCLATALFLGNGNTDSIADTVDSAPPAVSRSISLPADKTHLGLYVDRPASYQCLQKEEHHHMTHDNVDYAIQMELWKGDVTGALQIARRYNQLDDWIVSLAPLASWEIWLGVCQEYAQRLEEAGSYHKAVSYLLAAHDIYAAVDLFLRHKLYREAVALAKVRLPPSDPVLQQVYSAWSMELMKSGAYEQAAKCYLAMGRFADAATAVNCRDDCLSLTMACHLCLATEGTQQAYMYGHQLVSRYLVNQQWQPCLDFLQQHKAMKVYAPLVGVHEILVTELGNMMPEKPFALLSQMPSFNDDTPTKVMDVPDLILNTTDTDPVMPWDPYLISGCLFPQHVLSVWSHHNDMPIDGDRLRALYHHLESAFSGRQSHLNLQQVLLQLSADVTLWLLALITDQIAVAMGHLLTMLSTLYEGSHNSLLAATCRLILPQGAGCLFRVHRELSSLNGENEPDVNVDRERCYVPDVTDGSCVSTRCHRCSVVDCVQAFLYVSVLWHHRTAVGSNSGPSDDHLPREPGRDAINDGRCMVRGSKSGVDVVKSPGCGNGYDGETVCESEKEHREERSGGLLTSSPSGENGHVAPSFTGADGDVHVNNSLDVCRSDPEESTVGGHGRLTLCALLRLSRGVLWDVQAKHTAISKAVDCVQKAMSRKLLEKPIAQAHRHPNTLDSTDLHPQPDVPCDACLPLSFVATVDGDVVSTVDDPCTIKSRLVDDTEDACSATVSSDFAVSASPENSALWTHVPSLDPPENYASSLTTSSMTKQQSNTSLETSTIFCHPEGASGPAFDDTLPKDSAASYPGQQRSSPYAEIGIDHDGNSHSLVTLSLIGDTHTELPTGWHLFPVDEKYTQRYVTTDMLSEELDYLNRELTWIGDNVQFPFPDPFFCVEVLLDVISSPALRDISQQDKKSYINDLWLWARCYAVTKSLRSRLADMFSRSLMAVNVQLTGVSE